jgi:hypothetical protein
LIEGPAIFSPAFLFVMRVDRLSVNAALYSRIEVQAWTVARGTEI